jgi:hypothetical protein
LFGLGYIFQTELSYIKYTNRITLNTLKQRIMNGLIQPAKLGQKSFTVYSITSAQRFLEFINPRGFFGQWFLLFSMTISLKHLAKRQLFTFFRGFLKKMVRCFKNLTPRILGIFFFTIV